MDKYLMPSATLLAALMIVLTFRYDMQPSGTMNVVWLRDRWTGDLMFCGGTDGSARCFSTLAQGRVDRH